MTSEDEKRLADIRFLEERMPTAVFNELHPFCGPLLRALDESERARKEAERRLDGAAKHHQALTERLERAEAALAEERAKRPGIVWSANGEAGDSTGRCEVCGEERDEPHTWEECARQLAAHDIATVNRMIDVEARAEAAEARVRELEKQLAEMPYESQI